VNILVEDSAEFDRLRWNRHS